MAAVWTGLALLGLETVFHVFPWAYGTVKTLGAMYLLFLAINMWRGSEKKLGEGKDYNQGHNFMRGVMLNALNPKSIFFAAAVLAIVFPPNMLLAENMLVVLNQFLVESLFYSLLAFTISRQRIRENYIKLKKTIDRLASIVLGGFGLSLVADRYSNS